MADTILSQGWLATEFHDDRRTTGHVDPRRRRLLARPATAYRVQFQAAVLRSFNRAAHALAYERRDFDAALLDFQNDRSIRWSLSGLRGGRRRARV